MNFKKDTLQFQYNTHDIVLKKCIDICKNKLPYQWNGVFVNYLLLKVLLKKNHIYIRGKKYK